MIVNGPLVPPGHWMDEASGRLRPAVIAYLEGHDLSPEYIAALRAYCIQWIGSAVWDLNPHMGEEGRGWLAEMRADVDNLTTRAAITGWLKRAADAGLDLI